MLSSRGPTGPARVLRTAVTLSLIGAGLVGLSAAPAQAHRDGCHRWHSCPSDSGSYICGDLGYDSECPSGGGGGGGSTAPETTPQDTTAPAAPRVTKAAAGRHGLVTFTVRAERGSRVVVTDEKATVLARLQATGSAQVVRFHANGKHTYTATATDSAGNQSSDSKGLTVTADAKAPTVRNLRMRAATAKDVSSSFTFTTEAGAAYDLALGAGRRHLRGTTTRQQKLRVWLPNGQHRLVLTLTDPAGNQRRVRWRTRVAVARPLLSVKRVSPAGASPVILGVTAPERSTGTVRLPGRAAQAFEVGANGTTTVSLDLKDGTYPAATVSLVDALGRKATGRAPALVVDTVAPRLEVAHDRPKADQGRLALTVSAEPQARVSIRAIREDQAAFERSFVAAAGTTPLDEPLDAGTYQVEVVATDAAGNAEIWTRSVTVVAPLGVTDWIVLLILLGAVILGGRALWRRRSRGAARSRVGRPGRLGRLGRLGRS